MFETTLRTASASPHDTPHPPGRRIRRVCAACLRPFVSAGLICEACLTAGTIAAVL